MKTIKGMSEAEYKKVWRENNRERVLASKKRSYERNKESILKANSDYRQENHERRLEIERESRAKNINSVRASKILSQAKRNKRISECKVYAISEKDLYRLYSDECYNCGSTKNQSIDHRIPISRNGEHGIGNLMTLCRQCNASKKDRTIMEWKLSKIKKGDD
jgi:5-methylcytosine-specific restriction endonuclease McrA